MRFAAPAGTGGRAEPVALPPDRGTGPRPSAPLVPPGCSPVNLKGAWAACNGPNEGAKECAGGGGASGRNGEGTSKFIGRIAGRLGVMGPGPCPDAPACTEPTCLWWFCIIRWAICSCWSIRRCRLAAPVWRRAE